MWISTWVLRLLLCAPPVKSVSVSSHQTYPSSCLTHSWCYCKSVQVMLQNCNISTWSLHRKELRCGLMLYSCICAPPVIFDARQRSSLCRLVFWLIIWERERNPYQRWPARVWNCLNSAPMVLWSVNSSFLRDGHIQCIFLCLFVFDGWGCELECARGWDSLYVVSCPPPMKKKHSTGYTHEETKLNTGTYISAWSIELELPSAAGRERRRSLLLLNYFLSIVNLLFAALLSNQHLLDEWLLGCNGFPNRRIVKCS